MTHFSFSSFALALLIAALGLTTVQQSAQAQNVPCNPAVQICK
jgi:hypothetical protein